MNFWPIYYILSCCLTPISYLKSCTDHVVMQLEIESLFNYQWAKDIHCYNCIFFYVCPKCPTLYYIIMTLPLWLLWMLWACVTGLMGVLFTWSPERGIIQTQYECKVFIFYKCQTKHHLVDASHLHSSTHWRPCVNCKGIENTSVWTVSYFGPCPTNLGAKCLMSRFPYGLKSVSESLI